MKVLLLVFSILSSACFGTLDTSGVRLYAGTDAEIQRCTLSLQRHKKNFNSHSSKLNKLAITAILLGVATTTLGSIDSKSRPGDGLGTVDEATDAEGKISGMEWATIATAGLTAVATGFTTHFGKSLTDSTKKVDEVAGMINQLSQNAPGTPNRPQPGDVLNKCD